MIICFECSPRIKTLLDSIVESEQYEDYSEAIASAVENLSVLQGELSRKGALVIGAEESQPTPARSRVKSVKAKKAVRGSKKANTDKGTSRSNAFLASDSTHIPEPFLLDGIGESPASPASLPNDDWTKGQEVSLDRWIFGQYNKLLPAKASCRALAHLLKDNPKGVLLEEAASIISYQALTLGDALIKRDKQSGVARDGMLSTAFPSNGDKAEKSRLRYAYQFVAHVSKQGQVSGLPIDLKLINHTGERAPRLLLTEVGWRFATLPNPILDSAEEDSTEKFTAEEKSLLLNHISSSVPTEDFAYRAILSAITEGRNTPDKIDAALQRYVSRDAGAHLSKSFFATQRSGAISRMADLGLVSRVRSGVRVTYVVARRGQEFLEAKI